MSLASELSRWKGQSILVLGDLMLDEFHWCEVSRISPEAPVPVCKVSKTTYSPGGAGNVASNIQSLGGKSSLVSLIGEDGSARNLLSTFKELSLSEEGLLQDSSRSTLLKSRVIAQKQQVVRVDRDSFEPMTDSQMETVKDKISQAISEVDVLVLSDYGKGFLTTELCQFAIQLALQHQVKVMVDPKGDDFSKYKGAYAITPNFKEFQDVMGKDVASEAQINRHGQELCKQLELEWLIITRSEKGMSLVNQAGDKIDIPTRAKEVTDITGAGDTVIAGLSLGLAAGLEIEVAAQLANFAAGVSVSKVGTVSVQYDDVWTAIKQQAHENS